MKAKFINSVALDLGSSKIAIIAAYADNNGDLRVLSQHLSNSEGLRSGHVVDIKQAENSVANAIYLLEKNCNSSISKASISLSGASCKSHYIYRVIKLPHHPITKQDIQKLIQKSLTEFQIENRETIHYFPIEYTLDEHNIVQDPVGMFGRELGVRLHIITADSNMLLNLANTMSKCQVEISDVTLAIYASGMACLTEDEQNLGSVVIDIGARTTSYGVFLGKKLLYSSHIPIGGWHITSDITKAFSISMRAAEKLKVLYGTAGHVPSNRDNVINLEEFDPTSFSDLDNQTVTTSFLSQVINPRVEEILELIKEEYDTLGLDHLIARRIVLTGGTAMLRGIKEIASNLFEKQVRIGRPVILPGFAEDYNPCVYSVAVGMLKIQTIAAQNNMHSAKASSGSYISKILTWLKENI
ncbi:MAG: cell division protein FtsA [Pseudomonadota bacterium]